MVILVLAWSVIVAGAALTATCVALFQDDARRREDAAKVLRMWLALGGVAAGGSTALAQLHHAGLL